MLRKCKVRIFSMALSTAVAFTCLVAADSPPAAASPRDGFLKAYQAGNYKDVYEGFRKLALDPNDDAKTVGTDLDYGVACLQQLGREEEMDEFREAVIEVHKKNWRLLDAAAQNYANNQHYGFIVAGKFYRGHKRGGGRYVNALERDRVRSLQLMQQALELTKNEPDKTALAQFHFHFAGLLLHGSGSHEAWRLQYLTDLTALPDYEEGYYGNGGNAHGAPVDADGNPIFYHRPKSYEDAKSDGERWRWMLAQTVEYGADRLNEVEDEFAKFLRSQFGVQTLAYYGRFMPEDEEAKEKKDGTYSLHTLSDEETIARLATGVKRFKLPDEFNWIKIYERIAGRGKGMYGDSARTTLAQIYEDRRQYVKAAEAWKKAIAEYGKGLPHEWRQKRLDQILGNWGRFEGGETQPAGTKATVDFRFRNGDKVAFEAFAINVPKLLDDVENYLKGHTGQLDWNKMNITNVGYRLVEQDEKQYIGEKVAGWDMELKPRPAHVDERVTVKTPLNKAGAYLLTARMKDGNLSRTIVWLANTVILKKQLDNQVLYFVADAVTGQPVPKATVDFFGWKQVQDAPNVNQWHVETKSFSAVTDADGQIVLDNAKLPTDHQWVATAHVQAGPGEDAKFDPMARFAYLGFSYLWYSRIYDPEYNQTKVLLITDRPVYRPNQTVQFKLWIEHAKYDQPDTSAFANQPFTVQIHNPKGEKIFEKNYTSDNYGGIAGELPISKGMMLGVYNVNVLNHGGGSFRVEEYKKPEFEVTIDAPKEPVQLGEKIVATVQAKYYFGAPVSHAKVKYKVLRTSYSSTWYPLGRWDWFYGKGYWWFAGDYPWYPGWAQWGCMRPVPIWWGHGHEQPEVVVENEVPINPDGTVQVPIDSKPAKELHGDQDHQYSITAEVVDESRRTIVGTGNVLVARKPFKVFTWLNRGHYRVGDTINASFKAQTLDQKPVQGAGLLTLYQVTYDDKHQPVEKAVQEWKVDTDAQGQADQKLKADKAGQYRLSYRLTDSQKHTIEGGYLFVVRGEGFDGRQVRFNDIELITDKREYAPGDKVKLLVNANKSDSTVLLFLRPTNGVYLPPKILRMKGKSFEEDVAVVQRDMPNFFIEAVTVADGKVHMDTREVIVPPEKRVVNVQVVPSQQEYLPGQKATVKVKLTDALGNPFAGSTVLSVYDKSVEYISGGSNVPDIREFFWKWRRSHYPQTESSLGQWFGNLVRSNEIGMSNLGVFGDLVIEELSTLTKAAKGEANRGEGQLRFRNGAFLGNSPAGAAASFGGGRSKDREVPLPLDAIIADRPLEGDDASKRKEPASGESPPVPPGVQPTLRKNFADTAYWSAALIPDNDGIAEISFTMPENLTGWKIKAWTMGLGAKVGQGEAEVVTKKNILVRLQAPRFFVQKDEVVLSANVHNYLKADKDVTVSLELEGNTLVLMGHAKDVVRIPAGGEKRVDWRVKVQAEGEAVVRVKAITDEESDAMEMRFPSYVHGMLKTDSFSGAIKPTGDSAQVSFTVPAERRVNETRLEVRYSPTLAGAMVDALPYLVEYPYGCTEQTLNRFVPTVVVQRVLQKMNLDLKAIHNKRTNLNAQEIGDDRERAKGWQRFPRNPVFDEAEVRRMTEAGILTLAGMQLSDGGWGWFSGFGEHSWPHTTATVVHGLQIARENDVALPPGMLERGIDWLKNYQVEQIKLLANFPKKSEPWKEFADNLDALVYMVLIDGGTPNPQMRDFLYRDRTHLAVYAKAMFGLSLHKEQQAEKLAMILKNIEQFVVQDPENQTAYLKLPADTPWWYWYGSETEASGYYLKLMARTSPKDEKASGLVKYLLNNRKHATYWNSTRDTAICIEAMADYLKASGEDAPDMTVEVWLDDKKLKEVKIDKANLFTFDNQLALVGDAVASGKHVLELKKKGTGPVYFNAYLTNFTLEDFITKAGLEVKVNRKYYKLTKVDKSIKVEGARGQASDQKVEKYERSELPNLAILKSGDLVEVELEIDSKNDYEYLIFEDPKAAGFEPLLVRSGYNPNDMGAYMELRDDKVCFFVRQLARGKHSVSYRLRAEIPGKFSALPTQAYAMYAPELKGNSDELKVGIED
ncbi:MAG: alpha-2-macroglobulin family protein [Gemmataceae bacterium]